jgi:tetratricopeptide (TPR) repeat protein
LARSDRIECLQIALIYAWRDWDPGLWTDLVWDLAETTMADVRNEEELQAGIELGTMAMTAGPPSRDGAARAAWLERNLGLAYGASQTGDRGENLDLRITHLERALEGMLASSTPEMAATVRLELGRAWSERLQGDPSENFDHAVEHLTRALDVYTKDRYRIAWASTQAHIGTAYFMHRKADWTANLELAKEHFDHALEVLDRNENRDLWTEAMLGSASVYVHRAQGDRAANLREAITRYDAVAAVTDPKDNPQDWGTVQYNLGLAWDRLPDGDRDRQAAEALKHLERALEVRTREGSPAQRLDTLAAVAHLHFRDGRWQPAVDAYGEALLAAEERVGVARSLAGRRERLPQISLLSTRMAFCLLELGRPEEAFARLEAGKTLLLSAERGVLDLGPGRLITLDESNPRDILLDQLLARVPEGGALVAPVITAGGARAFVVRGGATALTEEDVIPLPELDTDLLQTLLLGGPSSPGWLGYQQAIGRPGVDMERWGTGVQALLKLLWATLMGPIDERLSSFGLEPGAPVLVLPHGGLGVLPLHAASDGARAFLDAYTVLQAPSLDTLNAPAPVRMSPALVVADPTDELHYAELEAGAVGRILGGAEPLGSFDATVAEVIERAREASIVHMACHGVYDWDDPLDSAVVLAGGELLTWRRVVSEVELRQAPLVTLSACETGVADTMEMPDEVIGLAAGFLLAGASGVVSSLWAVDDVATALLMEQFYTRVRDGEAPASALREAQRWLRDARREEITAALNRLADTGASHEHARPGDRPYKNPFYWAAWTFTGAAMRSPTSGGESK